ncbi:MAG: hypothetical protein IKK73_00400 [Akkermansia sp.]|nr:hypothetical protein [Akkermansia sp.]
MKRFLIVLLMLSSLAFTGWQFYQGHESPQLKQHRNPGAYRESEGSIFTLLGDARVADYATSAVSIVLNLEKTKKTGKTRRLVTFEGPARELGIFISRRGIVGNWGGEPWSTDEYRTDFDDLVNNPNVFQYNGEDCLVLTVMTNGSLAWTRDVPGMTVVDASGNVLFSYPALSDVNNKVFSAIKVNRKLVRYAVVHGRVLPLDTAASRAHELQTLVKKSGIPVRKCAIAGGVALLCLILLVADSAARRREAKRRVPRIAALVR